MWDTGHNRRVRHWVPEHTRTSEWGTAHTVRGHYRGVFNLRCELCGETYHCIDQHTQCPHPTFEQLAKAKQEQAMSDTEQRDPLLQERQKTHGDFKINALIAQELKAVFRGMLGTASLPTHYQTMSCVHREALDMIALKLSRILSGQANFKDHWDDIAGYAKLGAEACE